VTGRRAANAFYLTYVVGDDRLIAPRAHLIWSSAALMQAASRWFTITGMLNDSFGEFLRTGRSEMLSVSPLFAAARNP
jgi:hypothetical protein